MKISYNDYTNSLIGNDLQKNKKKIKKYNII